MTLELLASVVYSKFECTTSKVRKQYDAYLCFWSKKESEVVNAYSDSLFVGHYTVENLVEHFYEFQQRYNLEGDMLHLGMDGPQKNTAFQKMINRELKGSWLPFYHNWSWDLQFASRSYCIQERSWGNGFSAW